MTYLEPAPASKILVRHSDVLRGYCLCSTCSTLAYAISLINRKSSKLVPETSNSIETQ